MTTKTKPAAAGLTDLDYDLAMLGDPIADDSLDVLSSISEAKYAVEELMAILNRMQNRLEAGAPAYITVEETAVDIEEIVDRIHLAATGILS